MKRTRLIAAIAVPMAAAIGATGLVLPAGAAVTRHSVNINRTCSKGSIANLQLQREDNGMMSLDVGVDMARHTAGVPWSVHVVDNGKTVLSTTTRTISDGSFSMTLTLPNASTSHVTATARNLRTGEVCAISATA